MNLLLAAPIVVPLLGAGINILFRRLVIQRVVSFVALSLSLAAAVGVLAHVITDNTVVASRLGGWPAGLAIPLVADHLAAVMVVVSLAVLGIVLAFAVGQRAVDERSPVYHSVYLVLAAGVSQAFLAGDLFNLFVAFELLLMASYVLMTLEGTDNQIRSGTTYVVLNVVESMIFLTAVGLVFAAVGTVSMADLPERLAALPDGVRTGLNLLLLVAFGMKAAAFPLYFWLPDAYPTAPSSVTAVFAGLLTKVGTYAILRTETLLFPGAQSNLIMVIAAATMLVGVFGAISHTHMKRVLSFHIVSQIGYLLMGIGLGTKAAIAATVFYLLHHIPVKTSLFLVEGIVEKETGASSFDMVSGMARRSGIFAMLFIVPALSLAGLPPFSGFIAKYFLFREGLGEERWLLVAAAAVTSILTLVSMTKIWIGIFWGEVYPEVSTERVGVLRWHKLMAVSAATMIGATVVIALCAGPIYSFSLDAAEMLLDPTSYMKAVRG
jgi:multicomponent Na+:H+ antiporter subunit D